VVFNKENVCIAIDVNICIVLNRLIVLGYSFLRHPTLAPSIPDFNCYLAVLLILVIEAKRENILEDIGNQKFPEFYKKNGKVKIII
jgi:hypothetical protein